MDNYPTNPTNQDGHSPQSPSSPNQSMNESQNTPIQSGGLENYLTNPQTTQSGSRSVTGKLVATIFSLVILVGGVLAGVFLVRQQQEVRSKASEQECVQSDNCIILENPEDSGSYQINGIIFDVYLTDENANIFGAGVSEDGCYQTAIEGDTLTWQKTRSDSDCNNLINIQVWMIEVPQEPMDPVISQCRNIKIYDNQWNLLGSDETSQLKSGDEIKISVDSSTTAGSIDQARFTVNGQAQNPTTSRKPDSNELYIDYVIPENAVNLDIDTELYHSTFGWF